MFKDFIEEAAEVDLEPKPASLWWTNTYASEEKEYMILGTPKGCYKIPFEGEFRLLGCMMNRQGKICEAVEDRMQTANKALWKDIKIYQSKDVPWRKNVNDWWIACTPFSPLEVKPGHGRSRH